MYGLEGPTEEGQRVHDAKERHHAEVNLGEQAALCRVRRAHSRAVIIAVVRIAANAVIVDLVELAALFVVAIGRHDLRSGAGFTCSVVVSGRRANGGKQTKESQKRQTLKFSFHDRVAFQTPKEQDGQDNDESGRFRHHIPGSETLRGWELPSRYIAAPCWLRMVSSQQPARTAAVRHANHTLRAATWRDKGGHYSAMDRSCQFPIGDLRSPNLQLRHQADTKGLSRGPANAVRPIGQHPAENPRRPRILRL